MDGSPGRRRRAVHSEPRSGRDDSRAADELKSNVGGERIEVVVRHRTDMSRAAEVLTRDGTGDTTVDEHTRKLTVPAMGGAQGLVQVVRDLDEVGIVIDDIGLRRPTLDEVFLSLTGHSAESARPDDGDGASPAERESRRSA